MNFLAFGAERTLASAMPEDTQRFLVDGGRSFLRVAGSRPFLRFLDEAVVELPLLNLTIIKESLAFALLAFLGRTTVVGIDGTIRGVVRGAFLELGNQLDVEGRQVGLKGTAKDLRKHVTKGKNVAINFLDGIGFKAAVEVALNAEIDHHQNASGKLVVVEKSHDANSTEGDNTRVHAFIGDHS